MLTPRPLALKAKDRKPAELGPKVRVQGVHLSPAGDEAGLKALVSGAGLRDWDKDGFKEHDTALQNMWRGDCGTNEVLEFELPEAVPLGAIEVWNFNAEWQTTNGVRRADVAVSEDGDTWQTVLRGAEFAEADGRADYDEPIVLKLNGAKARKVRFEHLVSWGGGGQVGLSAVVFHQAAGPQAGPLQPEDGATGVGLPKSTLEWAPGQGAKGYRVYLGMTGNRLTLLGPTDKTQMEAPRLRPGTEYSWRVDALEANGAVVAGRVAEFQTAGLVAWWKLDETEGNRAEDASGHRLAGKVVGPPRWAPGKGVLGGAMEFDGKKTLINCGRAPEFDFSNGLTVSAWFKVRQFDKPWQALVTKGDDAWRLQRNKEEGTLVFRVEQLKSTNRSARGGLNVVSKRKVDDGRWHHVVALYDGQRAALYLDGVLENTVAGSGPLAQDSQPVMIGGNSQAYNRRFNGWIDDVRLYGYGLSEAEVKALCQTSQDQRVAK